MALTATQKLKIKTLMGYTHTSVDIDVRLGDLDATEETAVTDRLTAIDSLDTLIDDVSAPSVFGDSTADTTSNPAVALGLLYRHTRPHLQAISNVIGWPIKSSIYGGIRGLS